MKILYFDTETTGLNPEKHAMIQIAGILEIDGKEEARFDFTLRPFENDLIDDKALEVHGRTRDEIMTYPSPGDVYKDIVSFFSRYIDKYDPKDKFYPAGYNVRFDLDFLSSFFRKNGDVYFGSFCNWKAIDALPIMHFFDAMGYVHYENYKLETVCEKLGINIQAHDALSDIRATRELIKKLKLIIQPTAEIL